VAECPEIGMASQGRTEEEALSNLQEATDLYLDVISRPRLVGCEALGLALMTLCFVFSFSTNVYPGESPTASAGESATVAPFIVVRPEDVHSATSVDANTNSAAIPESAPGASDPPNPLHQAIDYYKTQLGKTNLTPQDRAAYIMLIQQYNAALADYHSNMNGLQRIDIPKPSLPNSPAPYKVPNHGDVAGHLYQQVLAEHQTNAQLWSDLFQAQVRARKSNDKEAVARAEKELADFLAVQLGRANKKISPGMSLAEIMNASGSGVAHQRVERRKLVVRVLAGVILAPVVLFAIFKLRQNRRTQVAPN